VRSRRAAHRIVCGALDLLLAYDGPGNVRQLENTIERIVLFSRGSVVARSTAERSIAWPSVSASIWTRSPPTVERTSS
jgi:two-component system response regulator HydG